MRNDSAVASLPFANVHRSATGERLYALRLHPAETQILIASIPALFKSQPTPR